MQSRTATEDPSRAMPNNERDDPKRANERSERDEPRCKKSNTDREDPMRMKLRSDIVAPSVVKSRSEIVDAIRAILLRDSADPRVTMSSTDRHLPSAYRSAAICKWDPRRI
jgi:hypothetical protein